MRNQARMNRREVLIGLGLSPIVASLLPRSSYAAADKGEEDKTVDYLFVQTARGGSIQKGELVMKGVASATLFFSDRPERIAGHVPTEVFVDHWGTGGEESFEAEPPNAALSVIVHGKPKDVVVVLKNPRLEDGDLVYTVELVEGEAFAEGEICSLFIDVIGMPLTPRSYAGRARRVVRRTARRTTRRVIRRHAW